MINPPPFPAEYSGNIKIILLKRWLMFLNASSRKIKCSTLTISVNSLNIGRFPMMQLPGVRVVVVTIVMSNIVSS